MLLKFLLSDKEIIRRIRQNDRSILGELFVNNERSIRHYIQQNGGRNEDAEDILQEAIIVLWQNVNNEGFELTARISTYLFAIAKNKWLAELRKHKLESRGNDFDLIAAKGNQEDDLIDHEEKNRVARALEQLGSPCKDVLLLYYFEERNMNDIARILGFANSDVVKAKKYQCKKALEKLLKN